MAKSSGTTGKMRSSGKGATSMVSLSDMFTSKINPPKTLSAAAKKVWVNLMDTTPNNHFTESDHIILESYIHNYLLMNDAVKEVDKNGPVDEDGKKSGWFMVLQETSNKLGMLSAKLRLSPNTRTTSAQTKAKAVDEHADSPLAKLLGS